MAKANGYHPSKNGAQNGHSALARSTGLLSQTEQVNPDSLAAIWAQRAKAYAAPLPVETGGAKMDVLVFALHGERYGVDVAYVQAIYPLQKFTPVPRTPSFVLGIFSARGHLISIIDLWAFFGLGNITLSEETKIVVVSDDAGELEVGFVANDVEDVITIHENDLAPALATETHPLSEFTLGIAPPMLAVLDMDVLLNNGQLIVNQDTN